MSTLGNRCRKSLASDSVVAASCSLVFSATILSLLSLIASLKQRMRSVAQKPAGGPASTASVPPLGSSLLAPSAISLPILQWLDEAAASGSTLVATLGAPVPITG